MTTILNPGHPVLVAIEELPIHEYHPVLMRCDVLHELSEASMKTSDGDVPQRVIGYKDAQCPSCGAETPTFHPGENGELVCPRCSELGGGVHGRMDRIVSRLLATHYASWTSKEGTTTMDILDALAGAIRVHGLVSTDDELEEQTIATILAPVVNPPPVDEQQLAWLRSVNPVDSDGIIQTGRFKGQPFWVAVASTSTAFGAAGWNIVDDGTAILGEWIALDDGNRPFWEQFGISEDITILMLRYDNPKSKSGYAVHGDELTMVTFQMVLEQMLS